MGGYDEPLSVEHVERARMPWESQRRTECGRIIDADDDKVIDRDALVAKVKQQGVQRASMTTCFTCLETARRWPTWDANPAAVVYRAYSKIAHRLDDKERANAELRALGMLVEAHREEFDALIAGMADTVSIDARRRARAAKRARRT